jgi:hypothetical protein
VTRCVLPLSVATVLLFWGCGIGDSDGMRVSEKSVEGLVSRLGHSAAHCTTEDDDGIGEWSCKEADGDDPLLLLVRKDGSVTDAPGNRSGSFVVGCCVEVDK